MTGLLKSGASLPEAKELARHSDVHMTMRYTHIGIADQAKALASLPVPKPLSPTPDIDAPPENPVSDLVSEWVSEWDFPACPDLAAVDTEEHFQESTNPGVGRGCDDDLLCLSSIGDDCQKWRIGDSNP